MCNGTPTATTIYRNIFDNLLTRDADGKIVPQIGAAWRYVSDTVIDFDIRTDVKFHDGSALTPEDVVFSVKRITNPAFKSPQLGQFNSIVGGRGHRAGDGAPHHQGALPGPARPAGQALDRAEAPMSRASAT